MKNVLRGARYIQMIPGARYTVLFFLFCCSLVCWLAIFFRPRVHCGWRCMAKSPCRFCNVYPWLGVCDHRARLSRRHRHGHWLRWMEISGHNVKTHTADDGAILRCWCWCCFRGAFLVPTAIDAQWWWCVPRFTCWRGVGRGYCTGYSCTS